MRAHRIVASLAVLASIAAPAAADRGGADPLAAIDLHRAAIIADIVQGYPGDRALLAKRLAALRADELLSASLASSRNSLEVIVGGSEKSHGASAKVLGSATTDLVYTPLTPCRLVDTRGFGAPIQGGPFAPNERRAYVPNGLCGLPVTGVASMLVSFTTENLTPNSGGYLAILAPAAPVTASVDVFNLGAEWSASNTAVKTGSAAQFDVLVAVANAHVIVDILGYFAPSTIGNLTLADPSTPAAGNIMKGASTFLHNSGTANTFLGKDAGNFTTTGPNNTAIGVAALNSNTTGSGNTAVGGSALLANTNGIGNVAIGFSALLNNQGGNTNIGIGLNALRVNVNGGSNTAIGDQALFTNVSGYYNTAVGEGALRSATGSNNVALGHGTLFGNTTGISNIAIGFEAGNLNTTGSNNIYIGTLGGPSDNDTTRIGTGQAKAFIAGIRGATTGSANAVAVLIDSNGQLGTISSSRRFKDDIADMDAASGALMKLRPVTFHYKSDQAHARQYGLIAEEVAQVYPELVAHSADGEVETVMYQFLPTMLLNEVQKQQRKLDDQAALASRQAERIAELERERRTQSAEIAGLKQAVARMEERDRQTTHLVKQ